MFDLPARPFTNMPTKPFRPLVCALLLLGGCASYDVRSVDEQPAERLAVDTPEQYLLDVAIEIFDPDLEGIPEDDETTFAAVRSAESIWVAQRLKESLQASNAWGAVRIAPDDQVIMDLQLAGKILQSDGETLALQVRAVDQTGRVWLEQNYQQQVSKYAYDLTQREREPFRSMYNQIANDLLRQLQATELAQREALRAVSAMRFAQSFSPAAFDQYLERDEEGLAQLVRLPAAGDPLLARVQAIQSRDQLFVDLLQDYYQGFAANMHDPYREWRAQSYRETQLIEDLENSARRRRLIGWLAIIAGTAAAVEGNEYYRAAGTVGILAGSEQISVSFEQREEAKLHIATLSELGESLEAELAPSVVELQDRTITLTGTVRDQYAQWRVLLADMYYAETGYPRPDTANLPPASR
ncbi:MAG: hypothetical protein GDA55_03790 [Cellvibrionales bacterium]|nr:hypothetical protein [Cellvibrionales bacterium]